MRKFLKVLLTILLAAFVILYALNSVKVKYRDEMNRSADKYGLDKHMVYAVVKTESNFDNDAVSYKGAMGLMQITGETAKWCAGKMGDSTLAENLFDPETNIDMGCFYLSYLLDRFDGDVNSAVAAYNAGATKVDTWLKDGNYSSDGITLKSSPYDETDGYIKKVAIYRKIYEILY